MVRGRREGSPEPEFATMGDRLRRARTARGISLRSMAAPGGRLAEPHLPGRDGPGQALGQHPVRPGQRARHLPRRAAVHGRAAGPARRRPSGARGAVRGASPARPRAASGRASDDPPRLGRRLGAPDDRVAAQRRLPVRDLRGRRRVEPERRVPAPHRARSGATSCPGRCGSTSASRSITSAPATRSPSTRPRRIACPTTAASRSTRSGSSWAAGAPSRRAEHGATPRATFGPPPSCNVA